MNELMLLEPQSIIEQKTDDQLTEEIVWGNKVGFVSNLYTGSRLPTYLAIKKYAALTGLAVNRIRQDIKAGYYTVLMTSGKILINTVAANNYYKDIEVQLGRPKVPTDPRLNKLKF